MTAQHNYAKYDQELNKLQTNIYIHKTTTTTTKFQGKKQRTKAWTGLHTTGKYSNINFQTGQTWDASRALSPELRGRLDSMYA